jgi:hypothetical protein
LNQFGDQMAKAKGTTKKAASKTTSKKAAATKQSAKNSTGFFGLDLRTWISSAKPARAVQVRGSGVGNVYVFPSRDPKKVRAALKAVLLPWQVEAAVKSEVETASFAGKTGAVFILRPPASQDSTTLASHGGRLNKSDFARTRDSQELVIKSEAFLGKH